MKLVAVLSPLLPVSDHPEEEPLTTVAGIQALPFHCSICPVAGAVLLKLFPCSFVTIAALLRPVTSPLMVTVPPPDTVAGIQALPFHCSICPVVGAVLLKLFPCSFVTIAALLVPVTSPLMVTVPPPD